MSEPGTVGAAGVDYSRRFITFEGVEGAGKTTQIQRLRDALQARGFTVFTTREPGGEPVAEAIRRVLLSDAHPVDSTTELFLFLAARAQITSRVLRPHLEAGDIVLCDRFVDSTVVYQGYARGHDVDTIRHLNRLATGGLMPGRTIVLDVAPEVGLSRQTDRNRMEAETIAFHRRVHAGYLAEAGREPERFCVIDASRPPNDVFRDVLAAVMPLLSGDHP
jgi:dTMP kinase